MSKTKSTALILGVLTMSFLVGYLVLAWTEPTEAPPGGNVPAPLNTSINAQSKEGTLVIGTNSAVTTGLIVQYGNVGIGTTNPQASQDGRAIKLDVAENIVAKDVYLDNPKFGNPRWASAGGTTSTERTVPPCQYIPWGGTEDKWCPSGYVVGGIRSRGSDSGEWDGFYCCP